jgi:hypothetical protein
LGEVYLERADPRFAPAKFAVLVFILGPFIEPEPGSNRPFGIVGPCWSAFVSCFAALFAAFALARWRDWRALALVMFTAPYLVLGTA